MKTIRCLLVALMAFFLLSFGSLAYAATYYWANTKVNYQGVPILVYNCDGSYAIYFADDSQKLNVCAFEWKKNTRVKVYVKETGTVLFNAVNCNAGYTQKFTSKTDTSRTAVITEKNEYCI